MKKTPASVAAGYVAAAGFLVVAVFQLALALGAPLGRAAWGGGNAELSLTLRIGSGVATAFWTSAAIFVAGRVRGSRVLPRPVFRWGSWLLGVLLTGSAMLNWASQSPWERFIWGPITLVLAVCTLLAARAPLPGTGPGESTASQVSGDAPGGVPHLGR